MAIQTNRNGRRTPRGATLRFAAAGVAFLTALAACDADELLTVEDPDVVRLEALTTKEALPSVRAAVIGEIQVGYAGSGTLEGIAQLAGLLTDELWSSESFPTRNEIDLRSIQAVNSTLLPIYQRLHRARATAEVASSRYKELDPTNTQWAEVLAMGAYTYVSFAENYCSGVPFSAVNTTTGEFTYGAPETTKQQLDRAVAKFDSAIAIAGPNSTFGRLARVGKARAQLGLNDVAGAAATVGAGANGATVIPSDFSYDIQHSENNSRQYNGIFSFAQNSKRFAVADNEGINGLPYRTDGLVTGTSEPRLQVYRPAGAAGNGFTASIPLFVSAKYIDRKAPFRLASGVEARLIEAEAAMRAGNTAGFLAALNAARANARTYAPSTTAPKPSVPAALTAADIPATAVGQQNLLFKERAYHLFLEGQRLPDLRRLIRQYNRDPETVFPTGNYFRGGVYGTDVNFPIPFEEINNPSFTGCIDRKA